MEQFEFRLSDVSIERIALRVVQFQEQRTTPSPNQQQEKGEEPISIDEACTFMRISRPTLNNWRAAGIIRAHKIGRRVYLFKSELLKALEQSRKLGRGQA